MRTIRSALAAITILTTLGGCGGSGGSASASAPASGAPSPSAAALAGEALFFDKSLSASGRQSCGTCHAPSRAFTADPATDGGLPVPLGGARMDLPGFRNAPSLAYASFTPAFSLEVDGTPHGGFFRDGRSSTLAEQAQEPFITPFEMADRNAAEVVGRLAASPATLARFTAAYGAAVLEHPDQALIDIGLAIAAFETESPRFHPFGSKYDYWLAGQAELSAEELRGLALEWYVTRDINDNLGNNPTPVAAGPDGNPYAPAGTFYTTEDGKPDLYQYNDLPPEFDGNVNAGEAPYTPPRAAGGQSPTLDSDEIDAVVAFLCTLTDGYDPRNPSAYPLPPQCRPASSNEVPQS